MALPHAHLKNRLCGYGLFWSNFRHHIRNSDPLKVFILKSESFYDSVAPLYNRCKRVVNFGIISSLERNNYYQLPIFQNLIKNDKSYQFSKFKIN